MLAVGVAPLGWEAAWWAYVVAVVAALPLLVTGGVFLWLGLAQMRSATWPLPAPTSRAVLLVEGIYGCVRHPMYGGLVMIAAGLVLATLSPWKAIAALALFAFLDRKASYEESLLATAFPDYQDYLARVRKMLPGLY
jgi:protein-S-isoprenylcysteine O-methyltransferase Ste14